MSAEIKGRGKTRISTAFHTSQCKVCKHENCREIEAQYLKYVPCERVAEEYGISADSVERHAYYFGLDTRRADDTKSVLKAVVAKGFQQFSQTGLGEKAWVDCLKEYNKITGKHVEPQKNPVDSAKEFLSALKERMPELSELDLFELSIKSKSQWKDLTAEMLGIEEVRENEEDRTRQ